jgi:hypothetical protein
MIGVPPHTIRNWAARGQLQPLRAEGNRTIYDAETVVKVARRFGYVAGQREQEEHDDLHCCSPGCEAEALGWTDLPVPLCLKHAMAIWLRITEEWKGRLAHAVAARPPRPRQPVVYFVRCGDLIKIGTTICLPSRLDTFATDAPHPPEVLLVVAGGRTEERQVHALFADERVRGEWFRPSGRLMRFIGDRLDSDIRSVHGRLVAL